MKKCPFCAEEIQDEAIKCRYCGEFLDGAVRPGTGTKWYYSNSAVIIAILVLGPFAIPLVIKNPRYSPVVKTVITIAIIAVTVWACYYTANLYKNLMKQITDLGLM